MTPDDATKGRLDRAGSLLSRSSSFVQLAALCAALLAIGAYIEIGRAYYDGYRVPHGIGMNSLTPFEITHIALFTIFGTIAAAALALALAPLDLVASLIGLLRRVSASRWCVAAVVVWVAVACAFIAESQLGRTVTTDDEHTYRFIAQTLRTGHVVAPSPGADLPFFSEQFVVLTPRARYGKYPIGHPLLLAVGQELGVEHWVGPVLTALLAVPLFSIGTLLFGRTTATLALVLFGTSPAVLTTGATYLSQPSSALSALCGTALLLHAFRERDSPRRGLLVASGVAFGFGLVVRPLPGVLFVAAAGLWLLWRLNVRVNRARLLDVLAFGLPIAAGLALLFAVNRVQTGSALTSGYQAFHARGSGVDGLLALMKAAPPLYAMSVLSGALRLHVWLLGWPFAWILCALAGARPMTLLPWGIVAAAFAYRLVSPKAGVGGTGPIYLFEILPLLILFVAAGAAEWARRQPQMTRAIAALLISGAMVNVALFLPSKFADLRRMGEAQLRPWRLLRQQGVGRAIVFHNAISHPASGDSWAFFPRSNSPQLDDDVLFLRLRMAEHLPAALDLWRRRFPDRTAWCLRPGDAGLELRPLDTCFGPSASVPPAAER